MSGLGTRLARADDAAAIAAIYNEGIADRVATFETEPRTVEQITSQLAGALGAAMTFGWLLDEGRKA